LTTTTSPSILKLQKAAVDALEDIKARDIVVLKVEHLSSMFERVIIATAESTRQVNALANNVQVKLKAIGARVHGIEGTDSGEWALIDLGDIVVHVMQPAAREHYNLEELWDHPAARKRIAAPKAAAPRAAAPRAAAPKAAAPRTPAARRAAPAKAAPKKTRAPARKTRARAGAK
jgi:ribosome-associated protein